MKLPFVESKFFKTDICLTNIKLSLRNMQDRIGDVDYRIQFDTLLDFKPFKLYARY